MKSRLVHSCMQLWSQPSKYQKETVLLTARPWAERGSCSARDLFFVLFFFLSVTRPEPPLGQIVIVTFNHAMCDVYSPKAVET